MVGRGCGSPALQRCRQAACGACDGLAGLTPSQPCNPVDTALLTGGSQVVPYAWAAIRAIAEIEALADAARKPCIGLAALARRSAEPFLEPAGRDAPMANDEGVLHCGSFAK